MSYTKYMVTISNNIIANGNDNTDNREGITITYAFSLLIDTFAFVATFVEEQDLVLCYVTVLCYSVCISLSMYIYTYI